jgi:hypothetical protein
MEQTNKIRIDPPAANTRNIDANQADVWVPHRIREIHPNVRKPAEGIRLDENQPPKATIHACKASWRGYELARDRLKRADRDLGETAAFIAASLTTVTAIQAVISIAKEQLELSNQVLQLAFNGYITIFILILLLGSFRARSAMQKRARAERDFDQAKKGILKFCPMDQWPEGKE